MSAATGKPRLSAAPPKEHAAILHNLGRGLATAVIYGRDRSVLLTKGNVAFNLSGREMVELVRAYQLEEAVE